MGFMRIFKGLQGKTNEALENIADNNLISELEQHIRDSEAGQVDVNQKTAAIMGKNIVLKKEVADLQADIEKYVAKLRAVNEKDPDSEMIGKITQKLDSIQATIDQKQPLIDINSSMESQLKSQKRVNEDSIKKMKMELEQLKSNDTLIEAKKANAELVSGLTGKVNSAGDASRRLKEKQAAQMAELDAQVDLSGSANKSLDDELAEMDLDDAPKGVDKWL